MHQIARLPMRLACALPFPLLPRFNRFLLFFVFACTCASTALDFTLPCNLHLCVLPRWCVLFWLCALHVYALAVRYTRSCFMLCMTHTCSCLNRWHTVVLFFLYTWVLYASKLYASW